MHQIQRPISQIVFDIRKHIDTSGLKQDAYAKTYKVNQSTISRLKNPNYTPSRLSSAIKNICIYADIPMTETIEKDIYAQQELLKALEDAWDGSDEHAKALTRLLNEVARVTTTK